MENKVDIECRPDVAKGLYSNLAVITHSSNEFILDFAQMLPGFQKPSVGTRVIMTPEHVKRLLNALTDNVQKYETQFGPIRLEQQMPGNLPPMGFGGQA